MRPSYASNPVANYSGTFDPNPAIYKPLCLIYLFIGIPVFLFAFYCVWLKSSKSTARTFKILYTFLILISLFMHLVTTTSGNVFILPYWVVVSSIGICSTRIPTLVQLTLLYYCGAYVVVFVALLFYYRMDAILPSNHFLNKEWIRIVVYSIYLTYALPLGGIFYWMGTLDQNEAKKDVYEESGYVTDFLWDQRTIVMRVDLMNSSLPLIIFTVFTLLGCLGMYVFSGSCAAISFLILRRSAAMSQKTKELHRTFIFTMIAQFFVYMSLYGGGLAILVAVILFRTTLYEIANLGISVIMASSSLEVAAMILVNPSYRTYFFSFFRQKSGLFQTLATVFSETSIVQVKGISNRSFSI